MNLVRPALLVLLAALLGCGGAGVKTADAMTEPNTDPGTTDDYSDNSSDDDDNGAGGSLNAGNGSATGNGTRTGVGDAALDANASLRNDAALDGDASPGSDAALDGDGKTATPDQTEDGGRDATKDGRSNRDDEGTPGKGTPSKGTPLGEFEMRYYWLAQEEDHSEGESATILRNSSCKKIAVVTNGFADALCTQGSGKLKSGKIINYVNECTCGYQCSPEERICFAILGSRAFPYGAGSNDNALSPLRSISMDESVAPHGTVVYIPKWDGVMIPSIDGLGNFVHDGCFRVDDTGVASTQRFNLFVGTAKMKDALGAVHDTSMVRFEIQQNSPHCDDFEE